MNTLTGKITGIETSSSISQLTIEVGEDLFYVLILDDILTSSYIQKDRDIRLIFKGTEVILAKNYTGAISIINRHNGIIRTMEQGKILSKIIIQYRGYFITSIIPTSQLKTMDLNIEDAIEWMIKANEITVAGVANREPI